jgi:hypothetical protein
VANTKATDRPSGNKRLLANAALVAVSLLLLEGLSFAIFRLAGFAPYRPVPVENPHHPYLGWVHAPDITVHASNCSGPEVSLLDTDADGFSSTPHYGFPAPDVRIVITGGSTMFGVGSTTSATSVPSLIEKLIVEETGIRAEVHNIAVRGYQSFQEMLALLRFSSMYGFDLALAISARNDSYHAAHEQERQSALLPGNPHRASEFVRRAESNQFILLGTITAMRSYSYTVDLLAQLAGMDNNAGRARTPGRISSSKRQQNPDFSDVRRRAELTRANYALMDRIAQENGAEFLMVLQPTLYTRPVMTDVERRCAESSPDNPFGMFQREFEKRFYGAFIGLEKSFRFVDAQASLDAIGEDQALYVDKAHYNDRGAELLAHFVVRQIRPLLEEIIAAKQAKGGQADPAKRHYNPGDLTRSEDRLAGRIGAAQNAPDP